MARPKMLLKIDLLPIWCFHGSALFFTLDSTYDAYVHIFLADHYARFWFEPWGTRWYTGFTITSYPPLFHQLIALISIIGGLKLGSAIVILTAISGFVIGTYHFAQRWVSEAATGYTALFAVFASNIVQTIHIYGQLPTLCDIRRALFLALPFSLLLLLGTGVPHRSRGVRVPFGKSQTDQVNYITQVRTVLKQRGSLPYLIWTLYDISTVPHRDG